MPISVTTLFPSTSPARATTDLLSASVDLPSPDISCKWNHTLFALLWLASFADVLFPRSSRAAASSSTPFILLLHTLPSCEWTRFYFSVQQSMMNILLVSRFQLDERCCDERLHTILCVDICLHIFPPRSGVAVSYGESMFNIVKTCQTNFQSGCNTLHSYQQCMKVPISAHSCQYLQIFFLLLL